MYEQYEHNDYKGDLDINIIQLDNNKIYIIGLLSELLSVIKRS